METTSQRLEHFGVETLVALGEVNVNGEMVVIDVRFVLFLQHVLHLHLYSVRVTAVQGVEGGEGVWSAEEDLGLPF